MAVVLAVVPEEVIIHEILIRLPVKSVARFRCVCKSWNSLLYNPHYLSHHVNCSLPDQNSIRDAPDCLILMYKYNNRKDIINPCDLFILSAGSNGKQLSDTHIDNLYVPYPLTLSDKDNIHLVGSINGLVCMALCIEDEHQFILWNPTIRFSKTILVPKHLDEGLKHGYFLLGFGFGWDSVTNDYKIITPPMELDSSSSVVVVVYSSNTNSWSNIKVSSNIYRFDSTYFEYPSVIVSGSPYWTVWHYDYYILKFDTRNDEFTRLDIPSRCVLPNLINLNDCLALIDYKSGYAPTVLYRFDEEHNIWVHMYTLADKHVIGLREGVTVCCFKYGGEIVFHDKDHLYLYDPMSNRTKCRRHHPRCGGCPVKPHKHKYRGSHECEAYLAYVVSYTPSLVALQGMKAFISSVRS